jgi:hypothetical protein
MHRYVFLDDFRWLALLTLLFQPDDKTAKGKPPAENKTEKERPPKKQRIPKDESTSVKAEMAKPGNNIGSLIGRKRKMRKAGK